MKKQPTLRDCLIELRDRAGSERKAALLFGISNTAYNAWLSGGAVPSDDNAVKMAALLDLDDAYALALVHAARAKDDDMRARWLRVAGQFVVVLVTVSAAGVLPAPCSTVAESGGEPCILCKKGRCPIHRRRSLIGRPLGSVLHPA